LEMLRVEEPEDLKGTSPTRPHLHAAKPLTLRLILTR
jgi:hypothetical protein